MLVFHLDISGNDINDEHSKNNPLILFILFVFHLEISGKEIKDEHLLKYFSYYLLYLYSILKYQVKKLKKYIEKK